MNENSLNKHRKKKEDSTSISPSKNEKNLFSALY
jgi:hypothetical protein